MTRKPKAVSLPNRGQSAEGVGNSNWSRRWFLQSTLAAGSAVTLSGLGLDRARAEPKKGGRLRLALSGGGAGETLDVNNQKIEIDTARCFTLFERLVDLTPDGKLFNNLAEEFSPNDDATVWKIKIRSGVVFHNGKTLTADDVVYTFRYILDPSTTATGRPLFSSLFEAGDIRSLDPSTVEVKLKRPLAILPNAFSSQQYGIFPDETKSWDVPIGTGPFKFKSWTRGERSLFVRNDEYRIHNGPYLDELEIISINDAGARYNALVAGQIDAVPRLSPSLVPAVKADSRLRLEEGPTGVHTDLIMAVDLAPFQDNRVRQAFRLMIDREQMVQNALGGHGVIGNDLPTPFDADYAPFPQRPHDPDQAKSLLKAAGQENLTVSLYTADAGPAMLESATLFAEQAKAAGVTVQLDKVPEDQYYASGGKFMNTAFSQDTWSFRTLPNMMSDGYLSTSPFNETHWNRPKWDDLVKQAEQTLDPDKRRMVWQDVQKELYDEGGFIIWGFINNLDAVSAKLQGLKSSVTRPLGRYDFNDAYLE